MKRVLSAVASAIGGGVSAILGILGLTGFCFCAFPLLAAVLAFFGISTLVLSQYYPAFISVGVILMGASILSLYRNLKRKSCECKLDSKKKPKPQKRKK